jgi:hypothetical protein
MDKREIPDVVTITIAVLLDLLRDRLDDDEIEHYLRPAAVRGVLKYLASLEDKTSSTN